MKKYVLSQYCYLLYIFRKHIGYCLIRLLHYCLIKHDTWQESCRRKQSYSKLSILRTYHMQEKQNDIVHFNPILFHI